MLMAAIATAPAYNREGMIHRALTIRALGVVGLTAIVSSLSCGGTDGISGGTAGAAGHEIGGAGTGQTGGVAGVDAGQTILSPFSETVTPRTSDLTPTKIVLSGQQAPAQVTRQTAQRQTTGAFSVWALSDVPRMLATAPGAVYYTGAVYGLIGRVVVGTLGN